VTGVFHTKSLVVFPRAHQSSLEAEPVRQIERTMGGTGAVVVETSSKNHAVSIRSEAHPRKGDAKPSQYEKVSLPHAVLRRPAGAA
jgi:hypothetical protein